MKKIVSFFGEHSRIFDELNERTKQYAKTRGFEYVWVPQMPFDECDVIAHLKNSDVGIIDIQPYGESIFKEVYDKCKLLVRFGVGFDKVDLPAATKYGICATRTTGTLSKSVADMALTLILASRRQLMMNRKTINSGVWVKNIGSETSCKTIGIVGFGAIGQELAKLLRGFDCELLVYDPYPDEQAIKEYGARLASVNEIFEKSDAISIHVPYCSETHHMVNAKMLALMKPTAVIVCTARGNIIDERALYEVLSENRIAGAGLDVFATEPLSNTSPLIGLDNIILTPHIASQTNEALWATYKKCIDISADFFDGKSLLKTDLLNPDYREHQVP